MNKMKQIIKTEKSTHELHSKVHEKGEEHNHYDNWKVSLTVEFDEKTAMGYLDMYTDGTFQLVGKQTPKAIFQIWSDGSCEDHARIINGFTNFEDIAVEKMLKEKTYQVNIQAELATAREAYQEIDEEILKRMLAAKEEECQEYRKKRQEKKDSEQKVKEEEMKAQQAIKDTETKKQDEARKTRRLSRLAWAKEHGSDQLRKGLEQGYSCIKIYEKEFGVWVLGDGYVWDRDDVVEEKDRSCPSLEALEIVEVLVRDERIGNRMADIKWLPDGLSALVPDDEWDEDTKKGCEAISVGIKGITGLWYKVVMA